MASADHFRQELQAILGRRASCGAIDMLVSSGELCRSLGGNPGPDNKTSSCCDAMQEEIKPGDTVLLERHSGAGMTVRYLLPRKSNQATAKILVNRKSKIRKTADELKRMALEAIRAYRGCETVSDVGIYPIMDDRADCNWSISVLNLGDADGDLAHRAAIEVQDGLSSEFDLQARGVIQTLPARQSP
jgi:hypothetical protein